MRLAKFKFWSVPHGAALLLAFLPAIAALAGGRSEKIQISDSSSPIIVSNLNRLDTGKSAFKQVEDDLFKSFQTPADSMEPVLTPPFRPQAPAPLTPHQRDLIEQRRNWAFVDPNDQLPKDEYESILKGRGYGVDELEAQHLDPIQKYYLDSFKSRHIPTAEELDASPGAGRNRDFAGTNAFNAAAYAFGTNLPAGWSYAFGSSTDSAPAWAASAPATADNPAMAAAEKARDLQRRQDFIRSLDGHFDAKTASPAPGFTGSPASPVPNLIGELSVPSATAVPVEYRNAANPILGASIQLPTIQNHFQDDPTLRALGLPQPDLNKPPPEPEIKPKAPPIIFTPPQRKIM